MHIRSPDIGYMFSFQLVGTAIPVAAGIAWASRYVKKEDRVVALFTGDASTGNGQFLEGVNAASIRRVPLLIVIEDNHLAGNVTPNYYFPDKGGVEERLAAFGIESVRIDGNKIDEVVENTERMVNSVRASSRPYGLICDTTRLLMHKLGQRDVRSQEEISELAKRDPILYLEGKLALGERQKTELKESAESQVGEAIEIAHAAPWPEADKTLQFD